MSELSWLKIGGNELTDISPLAGLEKLSEISIPNNYLDVNEGSTTMVVIEAMKNKGAAVYFRPQMVYGIHERAPGLQ